MPEQQPLPQQRVTLITLGVADLGRARDFYVAWGWQVHPASEDGLVLFQLQGQALALFDRAALAADQNRDPTELGTGAMTLAQNCASPDDVDHLFNAAIKAGARKIKQPEPVFWGGYSGYFSDPDGHVWEIAHNPFWPLNDQGALILPTP